MTVRRALLFLLPLLLLLGALGQRWIQTQREDEQAATEARQLVLQKFRKELEGDAYSSAQKYVRSQLLPKQIADTAQLRELTLTHLKPHRYKVRGILEWTQPKGKVTQRRVEADLQHGPTDKNWYLLDTEFLPADP
ncbi:hypothetical protein [Armatimonas sp.]|uniref:hypothetical protein n=1 Tax=Armatimonas sp. TaxID=1872638 RepID=UPI00286A1F6C|nr:hypothetical protein [Armatimonas sp.]